MKKFGKGEKPQGIFAYFNEIEALLSAKSNIKSSEDLLCLNLLETALAIRSAFKVKDTLIKMSTSSSSEIENVNTLYSVEIVSMA